MSEKYNYMVTFSKGSRRASRPKGPTVDHECAYCDTPTAWWRCHTCGKWVHTADCLRKHECVPEVGR